MCISENVFILYQTYTACNHLKKYISIYWLAVFSFLVLLSPLRDLYWNAPYVCAERPVVGGGECPEVAHGRGAVAWSAGRAEGLSDGFDLRFRR